MGWRIGRLIVWHQQVLEILQDVVIPYGDLNLRAMSYRARPLLHQPSGDYNRMEVYNEEWWTA